MTGECELQVFQLLRVRRLRCNRARLIEKLDNRHEERVEDVSDYEPSREVLEVCGCMFIA